MNTPDSTGIPEIKDPTASIPDDPSIDGHIFRPNEKGHVADTAENRDLINETANGKGRYLGKDSFGNDWWEQTLSDGRQVWAEGRNGKIWDAGINDEPKSWDPKTGLKRPDKPTTEPPDSSGSSSGSSGTKKPNRPVGGYEPL
jgi:hypothetical protein